MDRFSLESAADMARNYSLNSPVNRDEDGYPDLETSSVNDDDVIPDRDEPERPICAAGRFILDECQTINEIVERMRKHEASCAFCNPSLVVLSERKVA